MIKAAIEKIEEMARPHFFRDSATCKLYYDNGHGPTEIKNIYPMPETLHLGSLDALVTVLKEEVGDADCCYGCVPYYVSVVSPEKVVVFSKPDPENSELRVNLIEARATDVPGFRDSSYSYEQAVIALRSRFQPSDDQQYVLDLLSHMVSGQEVATDDDGITQTVKVKEGIQMLRVTQVKPIVSLRPYRTFQEVTQPASDFLIRVDSDRSVTITEADGGMWRLDARNIIKTWLVDALSDEIVSGRVRVML